MNGKILKVSSNDLYGNADDRQVVVFCAFNHLKYMNKYVIFAFSDKYNEKKLCYGSVHLKKDSLVSFAINSNDIINDFVTKYLSGNLDSKEYEIIDISDINKIELVSYSEMECDKLKELDDMSIKREKVEVTNNNNNKKSGLYTLLFIMIALLIGVTYIYLNPNAFKEKMKILECNMYSYNKKTELNYHSDVVVRFNEEDEMRSYERIDIYKFEDDDIYSDFKENHKESEYFNITGSYKYNDDDLELRIIYEEKPIINSYEEIYQYLKKEGYSCIEDVYYE